jgi:serine/threonine-protein kinase
MVVDMNSAGLRDDGYDGDDYDDYPDERDAPRRRRLLIGIGAAALALVLLLTGWWFLVGRFESVPDVVGQSPEAAREAILDEGLVYTLAEEPVYSDAEPGSVGRTDPAQGERLSPGDEVTVYVSQGPQNVTMPNLAGQDAANALAALEDLGFSPDNLEQVDVDDEDVPPGEVISTDPEAGAEADREGTVTVTVSRSISVPAVVGQEQGAARTALEELGLTVRVVEEESEDVDEGLVIRQSPDNGASVGANGEVTLTVSTGPPGVTIPDVVGMPVRDAEEELEDAGFDVNVERVLGGRVVSHQSHTGEAPEGTEITITATPGGIDFGDFEEDD